MALDDDMTTPPAEPDEGTPADRAAGSMSEDEYLGRDEDTDGDDSTTEDEEDPRLA